MKQLKLTAIAAAILLVGVATACNKDENGSGIDHTQPIDISEIKNATFADSLAYYMGQTAAVTYWQMSEQDTTISGEQRAKAFQEGFNAAIAKLQSDRAYALGYASAVMAYEDIDGINNNLDLKLDAKRMAQGFNFGMKGKDAVDRIKLQSATMELQSKMGVALSQKQMESVSANQQAAMTEALNKAADAAGANLTTPSGIRYKVDTKGKGDAPVEGDIVTVSIAFKDLNGNIVQTTQNEQGEYMSFVLSPSDVPYKAFMEVIQSMKPGSRAEFFVPASLAEGKVGDHILDVKLSNVKKQ